MPSIALCSCFLLPMYSVQRHVARVPQWVLLLLPGGGVKLESPASPRRCRRHRSESGLLSIACASDRDLEGAPESFCVPIATRIGTHKKKPPRVRSEGVPDSPAILPAFAANCAR